MSAEANQNRYKDQRQKPNIALASLNETEYYYEDEVKRIDDGYEYYYEENEQDNVPLPPPPLSPANSVPPNIHSLLGNLAGDEPLPLPYDSGCVSKAKYTLQSFLVTHRRIYALYLLFESTWPRALVLLDMYTDFLVAYALYKGGEKIWFMLSCLFIVLPFVLVWSVSLRFIQLHIQRLFDRMTTKESKLLPCVQLILNAFLMVYMFPPVGAVLMATAEIFWVISDIVWGTKAFLFGTGLIETENRQVRAMKSYRRAVEVFAESVPQTFLQLYIFIRLSILDNNSDVETVEYQGVEINALTLSFGVSILNLFYNFYKFKSEAQIHGMSWAEYALSVLQLAEVPIIKLVPRAPAIKKGYIDHVNFGGFRFDKESLSPLLDAINSTKCRLKSIKMSIGSLSKLDIQSCTLLGNLLNNTGVKVLISRSLSLLHLKNLFQSLDTKNNGFLEEEDFLSAIKQLNCSIQNATTHQKKRIFQKLAIRRPQQRDRVYFYDFFKTSASIEDNFLSINNIDFDLCMIEYPLHYIFQRIRQIVESEEIISLKQEQIIINSLNNLYYFCEGFCILNQFDSNLSNHVFYEIIDVLCVLNSQKSKYANYKRFVSELFDRLLKANVFDESFYLHRNHAFKSAKHEQKLQLLNASDLANKLQKARFEGCNIFEYCFQYKPEYRANQCKLFTRLFDVWLTKTNEENIKEQITTPNGQLYHLWNETNGFHMLDNDGHSPLFYSVKYGLNNVIECFAKVVIPCLARKGNCPWLQDHTYLNTILHQLLKTEAKAPSSDALKLLLSSNIFNLKYTYEGKHLADHILIYRFTAKTQSRKEYLFKCFQILPEFGYDFAEFLDTERNNALHYVSYLNDIEAATFILDACRAKSQSCVKKVLNAKNKQNRTALDKSFLSNSVNITKLLIIQEQQKVDYNQFVSKLKTKNSINSKESRKIRNEWISCLHQLMRQNKTMISTMSRDTQRNMHIEISEIFRVEKRQLEVIKRRPTMTSKNTDRSREKLIHSLTIIQGKLEKYVETTHLPSTSSQYRLYSKSSDSASDAMSPINSRQRSTTLSHKQWYHKSIKDTRNNSCISIKNISPKDAAISWLSIDLIASIMQSAMWVSALWWNEWTYPFEVGLNLMIYYVCFGLWVVVVITDLLGLYGIMRCVRWCMVIKLITFLLSMLLTDFPVALAFYVTERTPTRMILIAVFALNCLYTGFGFYDIYKIYKWIKYYENGGKYSTEYMESERIMSRMYKIVNLDQRWNGSMCKVVLILDENTYRIVLVDDIWVIGPRIINKANLEVAHANGNENNNDGDYLYSKRKNVELSLSECVDSDFEQSEEKQSVEDKPFSLLELKKEMNQKILLQRNERLHGMEHVHDHILMGNVNNVTTPGWL